MRGWNYDWMESVFLVLDLRNKGYLSVAVNQNTAFNQSTNTS